MIPENFRISTFTEDGIITLFPHIPGRNECHLVFVLPTYKVSSDNARNIGDKVLEVASYIDLLMRGESVVEKIDPDNIPEALGYSSWTKVKKTTKSVHIWRGSPTNPQMLSITPMHPYGIKGPSYTLKDESYIKYASTESTDIGHAILDASAVF